MLGRGIKCWSAFQKQLLLFFCWIILFMPLLWTLFHSKTLDCWGSVSSFEMFSTIFTTFKKSSLGGSQVLELEKHTCLVEEKMVHSASLMAGPLDFLIEILVLLTRNAWNVATTVISGSPGFFPPFISYLLLWAFSTWSPWQISEGEIGLA